MEAGQILADEDRGRLLNHVCAECGERSERPGLCPRDSQPFVVADDPLIGADLGRYRIARAIASGGMGRVYLGVQPEIGSRVAIKVLSEQCARDADLVERFFAEARAVNLIAHENIINVLGLATLDDGRPYIVMEHVDGVTLTQATHGGRAPLGGIVHVFLDVLSALGAAHAIGIVHRDLKPDNIMVTAKGHARVLDFGIAKLSPQQQLFAGARTVTGALLGTPAYMAPEQIASAGDVDARSDIYAVGAVLFHAVTGRPPFGGATIYDIMRAQLEEEPPSPRSFRPDLPLVLERVIMRALAKEPAVRFQSAVEMAAALDDAAAELPDHQWFDLSRKTTPMRARGSGKLTQPPPVQRDTPPAISAVNVPMQPRRRAIVPIAIGAGALAAFTGIFVLVRSSGSTPTKPPDAAVAVVTPPPVDAAPQLDANIALVVADASIDAPRRTAPAPVAEAKPTKLAKIPTTSQVVKMDLGAAKTNLTLASTLERAHTIARMLPGVQTARVVEIRVGGVSGGVVDTTQGAWVRYRLTIDPPPDQGCVAVVTFGQSITVSVERGSCTTDPVRLPQCSFTRAWQKMLAVRVHHPFPLEYITLGNGGYAWVSNDHYQDGADDCK
ncbi:MAG: serine/threonine protein kinase [Myxococcota bacterium]|nr:serine/threonine protein kinase [Myxococcota bacterium]